MRSRSPVFMMMMVIAGVGCAMSGGQACASFTGLQRVLHATVRTPAGTRNVWRFYATFSEPDDRLYSWGGVSAQGQTNIKSIACYPQQVLGGNFFNPTVFGYNSAPLQEEIDQLPEMQWGTFATIGVSIAEQGSGPVDNPDMTSVFSTPNFIQGNQVTFVGTVSASGNGPEFAQNRADYAGDGDASLRVLMMQLTLAPEDEPTGVIRQLIWKPAGQAPVTVNDISFTPTPLFYGRCCIPNGDCVFTWTLVCEQGLGGTFIGCQPCSECCAPDLNGDQVVNGNDLLIVINGWGPCPAPCINGPPCPPDINNDCTVNVSDLLAVINSWGPCFATG